MIDITLNSLLFSDDVLSAKYHSKNNTLNFALSELLSIISNVVGNILSYLILKMTNYSFAFETVEKEVKDNEEILEIFNKFRKIIKIRLTFYFIIQFICMCAFIYYLTIFCALYKYSQRALFINYFLGLLTSLFYTLLISIFISLLRYLSLKCGSKKIFMTSKYLNEKL
jgi:membrane protein YqaA with SNARE-associated domain